jgi:hypothetical protein
MNSNTTLLPQGNATNIQISNNIALIDQIYASSQGFNNLTYIQDPLSQLAVNSIAVVRAKYPFCPLFTGLCGITYKYDTFLNTNMGLQYLSRNISKIECRACCLSDPISRFGKCINYNMSSYDQLNSNGGTQFAELDKNKNCSICGLCSVLMDVNILPEKRCAGIIKLRSICDDCFCCKCFKDCCKGPCDCFKCSCQGCPCKICLFDCYDYYYCCEVLLPNQEQKYVIMRKICCLKCCTRKECGLAFTIFNTNSEPVGNIQGKGEFCSNSYTYQISFPQDATPDLKLCLLNAIYAIDTFGLY